MAKWLWMGGCRNRKRERKGADDVYGACSMRLQARRKNRYITELDEVLTPLPLSVADFEAGELEAMVPRTGEDVRNLDRKSAFVVSSLFSSCLVLVNCVPRRENWRVVGSVRLAVCAIDVSAGEEDDVVAICGRREIVDA